MQNKHACITFESGIPLIILCMLAITVSSPHLSVDLSVARMSWNNDQRKKHFRFRLIRGHGYCSKQTLKM